MVYGHANLVLHFHWKCHEYFRINIGGNVQCTLVFEFEAPEDVAFVVFLEEVFLEEVFLEEVFLEEAFLEEAFVEEAFLDDVFLEEAFLEEALLEEEVVETTSLDEVLFFFLLFLFFFLSPGVFTIFLFAASTLFFTSRLFT